jgi:hypothetical protein
MTVNGMALGTYKLSAIPINSAEAAVDDHLITYEELDRLAAESEAWIAQTEADWIYEETLRRQPWLRATAALQAAARAAVERAYQRWRAMQQPRTLRGPA